jgi:hypothetical protein
LAELAVHQLGDNISLPGQSFSTGNGTFDGNLGIAATSDFGNTILKIRADGFSVLDWFTPFNETSPNM